ncbi:MAG: PAS domain-containing protein [Alphaproteobacteria bacterium]|jgi:hypothetical protein
MKLGELPQLPDELMEFVAAWQNWRGDGLSPDRGQVSLDNVSLLLPRAMVLQVLSPTEAPFRLVETSYRETFGIELTGLNFVDLATLVTVRCAATDYGPWPTRHAAPMRPRRFSTRQGPVI